MADTAREEAAALWLRIIHTYEREPISTDASEVRREILDELAAMIRSVAEVERLKARTDAASALRDDALRNCKRLEARIEAALALHERHEGPGRAYCVICTSSDLNHQWPCPTVKALTGGRE